MAYAAISKPSLHMNTKLYTGNGSAGNAQTGVGFQPDFLWIKNRTAAQEHWLADAVRGTTKFLESNSSNAESSDGATGLASFDSDGFTVNGSARTNQNSASMVAWNWKANGSGSANTDGTINSTVSVNTTAGFSIVSYTGNATAGATVGHGLGATPDMIIVKVRSTSNNWAVYHKSMGATKAMYLDGTSAETTDGWLNNTAPTSSVFTLSGGNYGNTSGNTHIAYCFAEKSGYSKFGIYEGNQNADGTFVYTGFKPAFVLSKDMDGAGENWFIHDNKRNSFNPTNTYLRPNLVNGDGTAHHYDFHSNGFKNRYAGGSLNSSGRTYLYMAFAEEPLVANVGASIPATAR